MAGNNKLQGRGIKIQVKKSFSLKYTTTFNIRKGIIPGH
jgi:hypothetical protein